MRSSIELCSAPLMLSASLSPLVRPAGIVGDFAQLRAVRLRDGGTKHRRVVEWVIQGLITARRRRRRRLTDASIRSGHRTLFAAPSGERAVRVLRTQPARSQRKVNISQAA